MILPASLKGTSVGLGGAGIFGPMIGEHVRHFSDNVEAVNVDGLGRCAAEKQLGFVSESLRRHFYAAN